MLFFWGHCGKHTSKLSNMILHGMKKSLFFLSLFVFAPAIAVARPDSISDLTALQASVEGQVRLEWTVPDTGIQLSTPTVYLVKYATSQINNSDFYSSWTSTYSQNWSNLVSSGTMETRTLTGLTPGATLFFALVAVDSDTVYGLWFSSADASSINNANFACVLDSAPLAVNNLTAQLGAGAIKLSWNAGAETDLARYRIERSSWSSSSGFALLTNILAPNTTHQDELELVNGNTYYYKVRAEDNTGNPGQFSTAASTAVFVRAPAFSASSIALSTTTLNWAWSPLATDATGYRVILSSSSEVVAELPASATYWQQSWLTPDTSSSIKIQAFAGQLSADSNLGSPMFSWANPPYDIYSPLQPGTTSVNLQWSLNGNQPYTRYNIERSTMPSTNFTQIITLLANTTHQDTGLKEKTTYYYRIWASNSSGTPVATEKISASTMTASANPQAPTLSAARSDLVTNDGEVRLQWLAPYDDDTSEPVKSYLIKKATFTITDADFIGTPAVSTVAQSITPTTPGNSEDLVITGLYPGATFYFGVKAVDEAGNYSPLSVIRSTTSRDNIPSAPSLVSAYAVSETTVSIQWNHPAVSGYDDRSGYVVYRATFNFTLVSKATFSIEVSTFNPGTSYTDNSGGGDNYLRKEATYYYMLATRDLGDGPAGSGLTSAVLESLPSAVTSVYMPDLTGPYHITDISAAPGTDEGKVELVWAAPAEDKDTAAGGLNNGRFRFDWTTNEAKSFAVSDFRLEITTSIGIGAFNNLTVSGLGEGATWYFRIWSADEAGNWSDISAGATSWSQIDVRAPGQITGLTAAALWRNARLTWTAPGDDAYSNNINNGAYLIKYSTSELMWPYGASVISSTSAAQGSVSTHIVTGLNNSVTYYFTVEAADERNNWSIVSVDTPTAEPANAAPGTFNLYLPADNSISATASPLLQWYGSIDPNAVYGDTVAYIVYYSTDQGFAQNVTTSAYAGTALSYAVPVPLPEDKTVYWIVKSTDLDSGYNWASSTFSVRINAVNSQPAAFSLYEPNTVSTNTATPRLSWNASSDVDPGSTITYRVDYSLYEDFSSYASSSGIPGLSYATPALSENTTYYWRAWATDGQASVMSDSTYYFIVNADPEAPLVFNLVSPADNTRALSLLVTFYWDLTTDPDPFNTVSYNLIYSNLLNFASSTTITGLASGTTALTMPLDNLKYYWKVEAVGSDNQKRQSSQTHMLYTDLFKELPQAFDLQEPFNVKISTTLRPWFFWDAANDIDPADIVRYYIEISIDPNFAGSQPIQTGTDNFYQPIGDLLDQSTYYWRVRAAGYQGSPPVHVDSVTAPGYVFSDTGTFALSMTNNPPQSFGLSSPSNGAAINTKTPSFSWSKSVDTDLNDEVTYTIAIATVSNFSAIIAQAGSLADTSYSVAAALSENRTYYWKVTAKDKKGLETACAAVFSFSIPVINLPAPPAGLWGSISSDEQSFTMHWSPVTRNNDASVLDDLTGYNIYRALSLQSAGTGAVYAFVPAGTETYTDTAVQGGKFYYLVKAVDSSGNEGANSLIIESLEPDKMSILSSDREVTAELPSDVSKALLAGNNKWNENLSVEFSRKTELENGSTLKVYDLAIRNSSFTELEDYDFSTPVTLQFCYTNLCSAPGALSPKKAGSFNSGELSVYWHNGVEFIRVGGYMDTAKKKVLIRVTKTGQYQLRQVARASAFGVASLDPAKVFTPGTSPYEKMTFYVDNPTGDKVTGKIFDLRGEYVADIKVLGDPTATTVSLEWDGKNTRKGVYIYQIEGDGKVVNGTIILAR